MRPYRFAATGNLSADFCLVRRICGWPLENKPQNLSPAGGERGGHLPPRHPCHFQDERGDSALSRLGAQRTPAGLGLDRVGAPCYRPNRTKKRCIGLSQRPNPIHLLGSDCIKHTETMRCDAESCRSTHTFCGGTRFFRELLCLQRHDQVLKVHMQEFDIRARASVAQ
jgi:hypothetical protein